MRASKGTAFRSLWLAFVRGRDAGIPSVGAAVSALPRLLRAFVTGDYDGLRGATLGKIGLAVLYIVSPVDLVPELVVPVLGVADDAVVLAWLLGTVVDETARYLQWEARHGDAQGAPSDHPRSGPFDTAAASVISGEVVDASTSERGNS